jgi:hypothetical protein
MVLGVLCFRKFRNPQCVIDVCVLGVFAARSYQLCGISWHNSSLQVPPCADATLLWITSQEIRVDAWWFQKASNILYLQLEWYVRWWNMILNDIAFFSGLQSTCTIQIVWSHFPYFLWDVGQVICASSLSMHCGNFSRSCIWMREAPGSKWGCCNSPALSIYSSVDMILRLSSTLGVGDGQIWATFSFLNIISASCIVLRFTDSQLHAPKCVPRNQKKPVNPFYKVTMQPSQESVVSCCFNMRERGGERVKGSDGCDAEPDMKYSKLPVIVKMSLLSPGLQFPLTPNLWGDTATGQRGNGSGQQMLPGLGFGGSSSIFVTALNISEIVWIWLALPTFTCCFEDL